MVDITEFKALAGAVQGAAGVRGAEAELSRRRARTAVVCLLGMTFATSILPYSALGFVLKPLTEQFHWTREQFGIGISYLMWFGALTAWPMGVVTDRIGARPVIITGALFVGLVTLALTRAQHLWQFYLLLALLGVFGSSGASYSKVLVALFGHNRGKAMALFGAEGAGVRTLIPLVSAYLIARYGWRGMFDAFGLVILVMAPVLYVGLEEPGSPRATAGPRTLPVVFEGKTMREAFRDWVFWLMLVGGVIGTFIGNGILINTVAAIEDKGFSASAAGQALSASALFGLVGMLAGGYLMDRFATAKIAAPFSLAAALGYVLLMAVTPAVGGQPMLLLAVGLGMFAFSGSLPMIGYFFTRYFGLKSFATISGFQALAQAACMGFGAPLVGRIHDVAGNYDLAFEAGAAAALVNGAIFLVLPAYRFAADLRATPAPASRSSSGA